MSSMFIEDIMPTTTNEDDYKKFYYDESLPLFDRINTIIKKGDSMQRQALINNLNSYVHDSLFSNLIQFIIKDISSWEQESINLFPKSLYYIIIKNTLDNELFNIIFTCFPIAWFGIYDKEVSYDILMEDSRYYTQGIINKLFHNKRFWKWVFYGILQALFVFIYSLG